MNDIFLFFIMLQLVAVNLFLYWVLLEVREK